MTGSPRPAIVGALLRALGAFGVLSFVAIGVARSGLRWQHTGSLPRGLYRVVPSASLTRGTIALWCLPAHVAWWARQRGYVGGGSCPDGWEPLGKTVLALAGDTVSFGAGGIVLNGHPVPGTRPLTIDRSGRTIAPVPFGRYVLAPGQVWLWSPYTARSFDSRYFGPMPVGSLRAVVRPVWTFSPGQSAQPR